MRKSRFSPEYERLLERLRELRRKPALSQVEMARRLHVPQQYISRFENGETRLDVVQLWRYCRAADANFVSLCRSLDAEFSRLAKSPP